MSIVEQTVYLAQASEIVGCPPKTLQNWINREYVMGHGPRFIDGGGERGRNFRYSFASLIEFRTAWVLVGLTISPKRAFEIAQVFAHGGDGSAGWVADGVRPPDRLPAMPYHVALGETYLCADANTAEVVLFRKGEAVKVSHPIMIDVWPIFRDVVQCLGGDALAVLSDSYGIHSGADLKRFEGIAD